MTEKDQTPKRPRARDTLTAERLRELVDYDRASGIFKWRTNRGANRCAGKVAGAVGPDGHIIIRLDYRIHYAARLAWLYVTGHWPSAMVDHRNRVPGDNRWENLRIATAHQNAWNAVRKVGASGHTGAYRETKRPSFRARIKVKGRTFGLGNFKTPEEAAEAYRRASLEHHGEFAAAATRAPGETMF